MSVSATTSSTAAQSLLQTKGAPPAAPLDADGDHDGTTAAATEKAKAPLPPGSGGNIDTTA
ncbi:hypothetical protein SAMN05216304_101631 [Bosea sp. OK403]|uniref:hypothetical protein n=1 Tax=Bosea sp. OK403 TaxID=1855286 RepID=UPI0008EDCE97|nr:hypothetical protein [Bosea sp. OK403]SFI05557.1 hypothetical protein SAMN05216304_101631 [Bosea sp. OK403]